MGCLELGSTASLSRDAILETTPSFLGSMCLWKLMEGTALEDGAEAPPHDNKHDTATVTGRQTLKPSGKSPIPDEAVEGERE